MTKENSKCVPPYQLLFDIENNMFKNPINLSDLVNSKECMDILISRKIWNFSSDNPRICVWSGNPENYFYLNSGSYQISRGEKLSALIGRYSGFVAIIDDKLISLSNYLYVEGSIPITNKLKYDGAFYLFINNEFEIDNRNLLEELREIGLVKLNILNNPKGKYKVFEGRMETQRKERKSIDLTSPEHKNYAYTRKLWEEMVKRYRNNGFKLVNPRESDLLKLLKNCKYPYGAWGKIKLGNGVEITRIYCDCQYKVLLNGDTVVIRDCGIDHSEDKININQKHNQNRKDMETYKTGISELGVVCYDCSRNMVRDTVLLQEKNGKYMLSINDYCPSCGGAKVKTITISKNQLIS